MIDIADVKDLYQRDFDGLEKELTHNGESWTLKIRREAISHFDRLGFPTTREEEWKYTNVAPIARIPFRPAGFELDDEMSSALAEASFRDLAGSRLVFINDHFCPEFSSLGELPQGVEAGSLAVAIHNNPLRVESHLARYADYQSHSFVALNTAFMRDGAFLSIPRGRVVQEPIHLLFISAAPREATVSYPRNLVIVGDGSQATIVESFVGLGGDIYFTNAVTEIVAGENAVMDYYKIQREGEKAFHIALLQAHLERNSHFSSHSISLGGSLVRNDLNVVLDGEGGECTLNGLYVVTGQQHIDNHTRIDHAKPNSTSRELYKGVLADQSRGVFNGKIYVHKAAQKTNAKQVNKNLLLSKDARIETKPQLEIYNNDVQCSHGSTIGQLDQDALFYLRSRGMGLEAARSLLAYAFVSEMMNRVRVEPIRAELQDLVGAKFQKNSQVKETL